MHTLLNTFDFKVLTNILSLSFVPNTVIAINIIFTKFFCICLLYMFFMSRVARLLLFCYIIKGSNIKCGDRCFKSMISQRAVQLAALTTYFVECEPYILYRVFYVLYMR